MSRWCNATPWLAGALVLAATIVSMGAGPPADPPETDAPALQFNLSFVPAENLENALWTQRYLPVDADQFRRLVETVQAGSIGAPGAAGLLEQAEYTAQLVGDDLLVGTVVYQLSRRSDKAGLLALDPCSLALGAADWQDQDSKPATLGTGPDGRLRVLVEGAELRVDWSLRAERTAQGAARFHLALPRCPVTRLTVDAPAKLELSVDRGIARKAPGDAASTSRWTLEMGGHDHVTLRAAAEGTLRERRPLTLLRQSSTYELSRRGINIAVQLKLDVHGEPLQRVAVKLDSPARLVAARYGELQIPFAVAKNVETGESHVVLQLPEPVTGTGRVLQLSAIAPLEIGKRLRLPSLRPEGMAWQEGTATLLIPQQLVLAQLATDGCRQSRIAALPAPANGESIEIQYFRPGASVDVLLQEPRERLRVASGALVTVGINEVVCRQAVEVVDVRQDRRVIEFPVRAPWTIDAVEDLSTNQSLEWERDDQRAGEARVTIQLASPVSPDNPVRLLVRGHRPRPSETAFEASQLVMLGLDAWPDGDRLISVEGAEGMELAWSVTADLRRLDPLNLTSEQSRLFPERPVGALFAVDATFAQSTVGLERRRARYTADIRIDAAVQGGMLTETYTIQCVPETSRVDRLLVRFSESREAALDWNLAGANSGQFSARRMTQREQAQNGLPDGGESWEINLHLERPGPFEFRAVRSTEIKESTPLALVSVAQAAVQRGTVTIRALGGSGVDIRNRILPSVPAELLDADRYQTARATYSYQPGRDDLDGGATVSVAPAEPAQATSGAWVWSSRLDSRYSASGQTIHWASFRIQTAGRQQVRVTLPKDAQLLAAWIDDVQLPPDSSSSDLPDFPVDLPLGRAFATLSLYYSTHGALPALAASTQPAFAQLDIPGMARQWTVWLPPGYEIVDASSRYPIELMAPPTLGKRLFGAVGRDATSATFNPLDSSDWRQLVARDPDVRRARQSGRRFAQTLGTLMTEYVAGEAESDLTWGRLLALCADDEDPSGPTVLVDARSLAWRRMGPGMRVRYQPGDSPLERGVALLRQANLAVLSGAGVIAVTSATTAATEARQLAGCDHSVIFSVAPGPLADELARAANPDRDSDYQVVAAWQAAPQRGMPPWTQFDPAHLDTQDAGAWRTYTIRSSQIGLPRIRIVHAAALRSLAWPMFLAVVALGIWRRKQRPTAPLILGALAGILALLLPAAYVPLASGAFLGALVCLGLRIVRIPERQTALRNEPSPSSLGRFGIGHQVAVLLLVAAILNVGMVLFASQPNVQQRPPSVDRDTDAAAPAGSSPKAAHSRTAAGGDRNATRPRRPTAPIHRVFVPVDENRQLVDGNYYVPEKLYKQLLQQAGAAGGKPKGWLVTRAQYRGTLTRDPVSKQLKLARLTVGFDVRVLQSQTNVQLPFPREAATERVSGIRLDGRPIAVQRNVAGDAFEIGTLAAELYRIELDLQPPMRTFGADTGFDLAIPPLAGASIELTIPSDAPRIELPTARGPVREQKARGHVQAQLGACRRLSVRWPAGIGMETSAANVEAEELIWVKVRPGTTVFDVRFRYRVLEGSMQQVRLVADSRLRLLPSTSAISPVAAVHTVAGDPQRIELELARAVTDSVTIDLSFLFTGTSGVGNLQFPRLESSGVRAARRCLAVSVDPALESKEFPGEDSKPMAIADFLAAWGAVESRPQAAYRIPRGEAMWVLSTQPSTPRTTVEQSLSISLGRGLSRVDYRAALTIDDGYLFQLELDGPPNLVIDDVSLIEGEVERVARWSIDPSGRIAVFLNDPLTGRQRLSLQGHVDSPPIGVSAAPRIDLDNAKINRNRWFVYRQSAVLAKANPGSGVTEFEPDDALTRHDFGALVAAYESNEPGAGITLELGPNVPQAKAVTVTTLQRDDDRWMVELLCHVAVSDGIVDALVFEIPPQWAEPYRVDPPAETKVMPVPGEARRQLVVYPAEPITDRYELAIRGRVAMSAGDRLRVPDIVLQHVDQVDRFVVLPQRFELQQISWETVGLGRATLPAEVAPKVRDVAAAAVLRVEGERFQAALKGVQHAATAARVRLADIHAAWQPDGYCQGVACFDLEPAGATSCMLEIPSGYQLLHASIDDLPAQLRAVGDGRFRLRLGPPTLPQRVKVVYSGPFTDSGGNKRFEAPHLLDLEVDETLWTIYGPPDFVAEESATATSSVTAAQQALRRLKVVAALARLPAEIRGEHLPEEIARWYRPWRQRYSDARAALTLALTAGGQEPIQSGEAIEASRLDDEIKAVDARLGSPSLNTRGTFSSTMPDHLLSSSYGKGRALRYIIRGDQRGIELSYSQSDFSGWLGRGGLALALAALAAVAVLLLRERELPRFSPGVVVIMIGAAWWLFLSPSIVGLAAVALGMSAVLYGRGTFRRRFATR